MKNYIYIKYNVWAKKDENRKYSNRLLTIGFFKKWFKFKLFIHINLK